MDPWPYLNCGLRKVNFCVHTVHYMSSGLKMFSIEEIEECLESVCLGVKPLLRAYDQILSHRSVTVLVIMHVCPLSQCHFVHHKFHME
jgi:hypothetical protein